MGKTHRQERLEEIRRIRDRQSRDWFFDKWEGEKMFDDDKFDRNFDRGFKAMIGVWALILVGNLVFWGVAIWAIIQLVQWVQTK
jgi:hypothetical protein